MNQYWVAALVPMPRLLESLGFGVNERTRRCACILHGGSNRSAFSWTEAGLWKCHSCGAGGDRIALVRAVRNCGFREAVTFLAGLAGVEFQNHRLFRAEIAQKRHRRERAERAAWRVNDRVQELRRFYYSAMLRAERLCWRIGERLRHALALEGQGACWDALARLAPTQTFFLAAWNFFFSAPAAALARAALALPDERRAIILTWDPVTR
jgi:hypothetical protein